MALQTSGTIKASDINTELGRTASARFDLGGTDERALAGIASGLIKMSDFYGKSSEVRFINTVNRTAANIHTLMGSPNTPGTYVFENQAVISGGSASYALRTGTFPAGSTLIIVNKGTIRGRGGNGGSGTAGGYAGGHAIYLDFDVEIDNGAGYIFGGGGGGQGGASDYIVAKTAMADTYHTGGGGGAGVNAGSAGVTERIDNNGSTNVAQLVQGSGGSATSGGSGGELIATNDGVMTRGGAGGARGVQGAAMYFNATYDHSGINKRTGARGAGGRAVYRRGFACTITAGNTSTRIKGAVA